MSSGSPYPPALLFLPVQALQSLPASVQSFDVETVLAFQAALSLAPSLSVNGPVYTLPLALFGLSLLSQRSSSTSPSALTSFLSHFLFLWTITIATDTWWLLIRSGTASTLVTICVGLTMVLKVVSGGLIGQLLGGTIEPPLAGGDNGINWMSRASASLSGNLQGNATSGGFWSTPRGARNDVEDQLPGGYSSIYDEDAQPTQFPNPSRGGAYGSYAEEDEETDADAQHVKADPPPKGSNGGNKTKGGYTSLD
ncbi:unnamed protein product [Sympodiomycopsis kandeliae]